MLTQEIALVEIYGRQTFKMPDETLREQDFASIFL